MNHSILEYICYPVLLIKQVRAHYLDRSTWPALYEHVFTGVIFSAILGKIPWEPIRWPAWAIGLFIHVVVKEVFVDRKKRNNEIEKEIFIADLICRTYGFLLGIIFLIT